MCVTAQMARFIWTDIASQSARGSPASGGFGPAEVRKSEIQGAGSIPSPPRVLRANLLVGSAREQLNEESRAVPPGPSGLVALGGRLARHRWWEKMHH